MDNTRYSDSILRLTRIAIITGAASAIVLTCNALRLLGVLPATPFRFLAPLGATFGLVSMAAVGVLIALRNGARVTTIGTVLSVLGLTGLIAVEYITNYVFPALTPELRSQLLMSTVGALAATTSIVFVAGAATFAVGVIRGKSLPAAAAAVLVVGSILLAARQALPVWVAAIAVVMLGGSILWLALATRRPAPVAVQA